MMNMKQKKRRRGITEIGAALSTNNEDLGAVGPGGFVCLLEFHVLATSKVISGMDTDLGRPCTGAAHPVCLLTRTGFL